MILATGRDTGLTSYIFVREIQKMEKMKEDPHPFTRVFLKDPKQQHEYFLDVTEDPGELNKRIKHERRIPGEESAANG